MSYVETNGIDCAPASQTAAFERNLDRIADAIAADALLRGISPERAIRAAAQILGPKWSGK